MATGFPDQTSKDDLLSAKKAMEDALAALAASKKLIQNRVEGGQGQPKTQENIQAVRDAEQAVRDSKEGFRKARNNIKVQTKQDEKTKRMMEEFRAVVDMKNVIDQNIYNPAEVQPDYQYMQPQRDAATQAYKNATASRDLLSGSAANIAPYATGEKSYAREQGKLDVNSARNAILSRMAGNRGGGAASAQLSQRAIGEQGGHIMDQARAQGVQERLGSAQALSGLYGTLNQTDLNMNTTARQAIGQEGAMAQALADYKYQQELDKQARDQGIFNTVLGRGDADNAQQAALRAEAAAKKNAIWDNVSKLAGAAASSATKVM